MMENGLNEKRGAGTSNQEPWTRVAGGTTPGVFVNLPELSCDIKLKELLVDNELKLSCAKYIHVLKTVTEVNYDINEKLKLDPYPCTQTLALLALKVYSDTPGDKTPPELPRGWELLTTASNPSWKDGYFGAAFWCRGQQQVVVAHRGTKITNTGAMSANYNSIVNYNNSSHMHSAITFTDLIASALRELNKRHGVCFQLSITGHSLGGWLSQVTAFTVKYLRKDKLTFKKVGNIRDGFHAHTVGFDSPGCRPMLSKMKEKFDLRYDRSIFLRRLDISSYLSAPNRINSLNMHLGIIFRVVTDLSDVTALDERTLGYTKKTHSMMNMVQAWTGLDSPDVVQMLDWPLRSVLWGEEYNKFFQCANRENEYHQRTERYEFKTVNRNSCTLRIFSEDELLLLDLWMAFKKSKMNLTNFIKIKNLSVGNLFDKIKVIDKEKQIIECTSEVSLRKVIQYTKALMRWFPAEIMEKAALVPSAAEVVFRTEGEKFFHSLKRSRVNFRDTVGLETFLTSGNNVLVIRTPDSGTEMARLADIFHQIKETWKTSDIETDNHYSFMSLKGITSLKSAVSIPRLYQSCFADGHLFFIQSNENDKNVDTILKEISMNLQNNPNNKLVIVESSDTSFEDSLNIGNNLVLKHIHEIKLSDLTEKSLKTLFEKKIILLQGEQLGLRDFVGEYHHLTADKLNRVSELIGPQMLKNLFFSDIEVREVLLHHDDLLVHSTVNKEVSAARVARALEDSPGALLVISGIDREDLEADPWKRLVQSMGEGSKERIFTTARDGESIFKQMCRVKPDSTVYWLAAPAEHVLCKTIYKRGFYIKRRFHEIIFQIEKFIKRTDRNAIYVFQNIKNISERNKNIFLTRDHIKMVTVVGETDDIIKNNPHKPVHVLKQGADGGPILWQRSRGSLENLRPCVITDAGEPIDEKTLRDTSQTVVIIADEPGMGKSTTLTSVSRLLRSAWVIRVDLKDFQVAIQKLPIELSLNSVCEFILGERGSWLRGLLQFCLDKAHEHSRDIYIFFDGFDEIKRDFYSIAESEVLRLLEYLNNETKAKIWVTTRLYRREILENSLSAFAMRFERICESQQQEFLVDFWRPHLLLEMDHYGDAEKGKLDECAECVYRNAKKVLGDNVQNFMGIPLQMRMLADVCLPRVKDYLESKIDIENIFDIKSVLDLYQRFIILRYDIYFREKKGLDERMNDILVDSNKDNLTEKHRMMGLRTIFPKFAEDNFDDPEDGWRAELCRVGLVQTGGDLTGDTQFVHRTLAEFYCADLVVEWLRNRGRYHGHAPMVELLMTEILLSDSYNVTRIFINNLVLSKSLSEEAKKFGALKMSELWREKQHSLFNRDMQTGLHVAAREGSPGIVDILVSGFKYVPERSIAFLAAHNADRETALSQAVRAGSRDIMEKIVGSVESCSYDVILELLLASNAGCSSAPEDGLKLLNNYLRETAVCSEMKKAFATAEIIQEQIPPFLAAVKAGRAEQVGELCRNVKSGTEMLYMLLAGDGGNWRGGTALHLLSGATRDAERDKILAHIISTLDNQNICALGRTYNTRGETPLHCAAAAGQLDLVDYLISHGVYIDSLDKYNGETALFCAARAGSLPVAWYLIEKGADLNILNKNSENVLFAAAFAGKLSLLENLIEKGLDINIKNKTGENLLFNAVRGDNLSLIEYLIVKGLDINILNHKGDNLLFAAAYADSLSLPYLIEKGLDVNIINKNGENLLFTAACGDSLSLLRYLIDMGLNVNIINSDGENLLDHAEDPVLTDFLRKQMSQRGKSHHME